jgi:hypothetical protein
MSMNRYAYVNQNPVNLVDPSGMIAVPSCVDQFVEQQLAQQTNCSLLRGPLSQGFTEDEAISIVAQLLAAIGYQQARSSGYQSMVLTMVAGLNSMDSANKAGVSGASTTVLEKAQSVYTYACGEKHPARLKLRACLSGQPCNLTSQDVKALYGCVQSYMDAQVAGRGENYPGGQTRTAQLAQEAYSAGLAIVLGRCKHNKASYYFGNMSSHYYPAKLIAQIDNIDKNDDMIYAYSFNGDWNNSTDLAARAKELASQGFKYEIADAENQGGRSYMITNVLNAPPCFWQCPKGQQTCENCK